MATNAKVKYGFNGTLSNNTGTYGSPTWSALGNISDCTIAVALQEGDASMRLYDLVLAEPTLIGLEISGKIRSDESDTNGYLAFETAMLARSALDLMILDGGATTNGSRGFRLDWKIFKWDEVEDLNKVLFRDFVLKPCIPINGVPNKAIVATGAAGFTAI